MGYKRCEVSVVCTDDAAIAAINNRWRGKNTPTDVLSFSQLEGGGVPEGRVTSLGDVIVSMETAHRQAIALGHSLDVEIQRLLVHGVLHLLGHDHVHGGAQARRMRAEEKRLLQLLAHKS